MSTLPKKMPQHHLDAWSNSDAELLIIDGNLRVVCRGVGQVRAILPEGLYKVKSNRGGAIHEQLIELVKDETVYSHITDFPAVAPIGPILGNAWQVVEDLGQRALGFEQKHGILVLGHAKNQVDPKRGPLHGVRIFPWRSIRTAIDIGRSNVHSTEIDGEEWAAIWIPADVGSHVIEITECDQFVRQAVLVAPKWQTRVFVRREASISSTGSADSGAPRGRDRIDVSIQMASPSAPVVYNDHLETVEVARNALALKRPIFVSSYLIDSLLWGKFDNPIAGVTGLHLFLEALERKKAPISDDDTSRIIEFDASLDHEPDSIIDEVLANLRNLLTDGTDDATIPADLVALYARAGRSLAGSQAFIDTPPMFWASWDVLRKNAGPGQAVWVKRGLWSSIALSTAWGPYLSWIPSQIGLEKFVQQVTTRTEEELAGTSSRTQNFTLNKISAFDGGGFLKPSVQGQSLSDELLDALGIPLSAARRTPPHR
jgi:hypothetical protein